MNRILTGLFVLLVVGLIAYFGGLKGNKDSNNLDQTIIQGDGPDSRSQLRSKDIENQEIVLLATSSRDAKAVVRLSSGVSEVVSIGDQIGIKALTLTDISKDKIVLKDSSSNEVYFVYLVDADGKSKKQILFSEISIETPRPVTPILDTAGTSSQ